MMKKGGKGILLAILMFLPLCAEISAAGRQEDRLPEALQLIEEKKYSDAVKILADVIKKNPEKLDEAEALMSAIRSARNQYNAKYANLLQLLKKEDLNDEDIATAYDLISEMEELDAAPDNSITGSFDQARRSIVFRYNDLLFQEVMDEALALIEEGRPWEAIAVYPKAIGLHKDIFIEDYPADIVAETDPRISAVRNDIQAVLTYRQAYTQASNRALNEAQRNVFDPVRESEYSDLINITANMSVFRESAHDNSIFMEEKKEELLAPGEYDVPYLSVVNRIITGRRDDQGLPRDEGILYAVDIMWESSRDEIRDVLSDKAETAFALGVERFSSENYTDAERSFDISRYYSSIDRKLITLKRYSMTPVPPPDLSEAEIAGLFDNNPEYLYSDSLVKASEDYALLTNIMNRAAVVKNTLPAKPGRDEISGFRESISDDRNIVSIGLQVWEELILKAAQLGLRGFDAEKTEETAEEMREVFRNSGEELDNLDIELVRANFELRYNPVSDILENQKTEVAEAVNFVEGVEKTFGEGEESFNSVVKYSDDAFAILQSSRDILAETERELIDITQVLGEENPSVQAAPVIAEAFRLAAEDIAETQRLSAIVNNYLQRSSELLTQAEVFRNQGNRYLDEARALLGRSNFTEARDRLQLARESFRNSLLNNEDQELRDYSDREILAVSEEILQRQTRVVIDTVRRNLASARDLYARERFGDAENLLISSQTLWETVNAEANQEIEYWLSLVQTALSVRSGRFIAETDPLYNEMTQVINLARNDYLNAVDAESAGRKAVMDNFIASAEEKLNYISIPFPLNQEASILSLRILRLKDKENFDELFKERFDLARQQLSVNPAEAYINLKDLQAINPAYPGMNQAIYQAEINLGIRKLPPDPARLRQAEQLYQQAFSIVSSNVRSNFPTALDLLNRAFELNPDDAKITNLKDRVQSEMGGSTTVVLSSYAQEQYRLAEQEFINGNYFASLAIVNRLLLDDKNKKYSPLIELKRRIDSKI